MYIGVSSALQSRLYSHFYDLRKGTHTNAHLQRSFDKYKEAAFEKLIVHSGMQCLGIARLLEQVLIAGIPSNLLFNQAPVSNSMSGYKHSQGTKECISRKSTEYWKSRTPHQMQVHAEVSRKRATGRVFSEAAREKMRNAKLGKSPWNKGISTKELSK